MNIDPDRLIIAIVLTASALIAGILLGAILVVLFVDQRPQINLSPRTFAEPTLRQSFTHDNTPHFNYGERF